MQMRIAVFLLILAGPGFLRAQNPPSIKRVPVGPTSAASGQEMFNTYCAVCHGKEGKGDGPAAAALKKAPADLTTITARHNGKFPEFDIHQSILGDGSITAHGSREMPVWGDILKSLDGGSNSGSDSIVRLRIENLTLYIKSIQRK